MNQVEIWKWNDATKKLSSVRVPADQAQVLWIARLAGELARIRPGNYDDQRRALVLRLQAAGIAGAATNSIDTARLAQADPRQLSDALAEALEHNYSHAARVLVEALSKHATAEILLTADGKPSPLAQALRSPNRRVRFAALKTIMAINPANPYPGSSFVPDALAWFADGMGDDTAVVAMPTIAAAGDLAGRLAAFNLVAEATNRGRDAVDLSLAMPDLRIILIDMNIIEPDIRQCVYELRIHPTTGDIPIAILAADGRLNAAKRIASEHTRVIAVPRPHSPAVLAGIVEQLNTLAAADVATPEERRAKLSKRRNGSPCSPPATARSTPFAAPTIRTPSPRPLAEPPASEAIPTP